MSNNPWDAYRPRYRAFCLAVILFPLWIFPGALIQYFLARRGFDSGSPIQFLLVVLPPFPYLVATYLRYIFWPCPECGRPFHATLLTGAWLFVRQCVHCGLPKWELPPKMKGKAPVFDEL